MTYWAEAFSKVYPNVKIQVEGKGSATAPPALTQGTAQLGPDVAEDEARGGRRLRGQARLQADADRRGRRLPGRVRPQGQSHPRLHAGPTGLHLLEDPQERLRRHRHLGRRRPDGRLGQRCRSASTAAIRPAAPTSISRSTCCEKGDYKDTVKEQPGSAAVVNGVANDRGGIGYSGIGYKTSEVRAVPLAKSGKDKLVEPTFDNALNGTYPLGRMLYIYVAQEAGRAAAAAGEGVSQVRALQGGTRNRGEGRLRPAARHGPSEATQDRGMSRPRVELVVMPRIRHACISKATLRRVKRRDKAARWVVTLGGMAVIASVMAIVVLIVGTIVAAVSSRPASGSSPSCRLPASMRAATTSSAVGVEMGRGREEAAGRPPLRPRRDGHVPRSAHGGDLAAGRLRAAPDDGRQTDAVAIRAVEQTGPGGVFAGLVRRHDLAGGSGRGRRRPAQPAGQARLHGPHPRHDSAGKGPAAGPGHGAGGRRTRKASSPAPRCCRTTASCWSARSARKTCRRSRPRRPSGRSSSNETAATIGPLALDAAGANLYAGTSDGVLLWWRLDDDGRSPQQEVTPAFRDQRAVTALGVLLGDVSLAVGDAQRQLTTWFFVRTGAGQSRKLRQIHTLAVPCGGGLPDRSRAAEQGPAELRRRRHGGAGLHDQPSAGWRRSAGTPPLAAGRPFLPRRRRAGTGCRRDA